MKQTYKFGMIRMFYMASDVFLQSRVLPVGLKKLMEWWEFGWCCLLNWMTWKKMCVLVYVFLYYYLKIFIRGYYPTFSVQTNTFEWILEINMTRHILAFEVIVKWSDILIDRQFAYIWGVLPVKNLKFSLVSVIWNFSVFAIPE